MKTRYVAVYTRSKVLVFTGIFVTTRRHGDVTVAPAHFTLGAYCSEQRYRMERHVMYVRAYIHLHFHLYISV